MKRKKNKVESFIRIRTWGSDVATKDLATRAFGSVSSYYRKMRDPGQISFNEAARVSHLLGLTKDEETYLLNAIREEVTL